MKTLTIMGMDKHDYPRIYLGDGKDIHYMNMVLSDESKKGDDFEVPIEGIGIGTIIRVRHQDYLPHESMYEGQGIVIMMTKERVDTTFIERLPVPITPFLKVWFLKLLTGKQR